MPIFMGESDGWMVERIRAAGSPLVCVQSDGVLLCRQGVHGFGRTFGEALAKLEAAEATRKGGG